MRHLRADPSTWVRIYRSENKRRDGIGLKALFFPWSVSLLAVPVNDQEQSFLIHARTQDFQDLVVQGTVVFRICEPERLARRIDFTVDKDTGRYLRSPREKIASRMSELAQKHSLAHIAEQPLVALLSQGLDTLRSCLDAGLRGDETLQAMGIEVVSVSLTDLSPEPELERAIQAPRREAIQERADEAAFARRAKAVDNERAIQENELNNQIELAARERALIEKRGKNERRVTTQKAELENIAAQGQARDRETLARAEASSIEQVEGIRLDLESRRIKAYEELDPASLLALAANTLSENPPDIEHLQIGGEIFESLLQSFARRTRGGEAGGSQTQTEG